MNDPEPARKLFRNARREALIVAAVWAICFAWTIAVSWLLGYPHDADSLPVRIGLIEANPAPHPKLIAGFPDWIFWGIMVPWVLSGIFTIWFGLYGMSDDDLGAEAKEEAGHGH